MTTREEQELAKTVADGTKDTGGRRDDLLTPMALADRLQSLGNEIENQHQIVYARPAETDSAEDSGGDGKAAGGYSPRTADAIRNARHSDRGTRKRIGCVVIAADDAAGGDAQRYDTQNACRQAACRLPTASAVARDAAVWPLGNVFHCTLARFNTARFNRLIDERAVAASRFDCARRTCRQPGQQSVAMNAPAARSTRIGRWRRRRTRQAQGRRIPPAPRRSTADTPARDIQSARAARFVRNARAHQPRTASDRLEQAPLERHVRFLHQQPGQPVAGKQIYQRHDVAACR